MPATTKTILFVWELGGGLGHIMELAPLVNAMCAAGHRVYAAMRELSACSEAFDERAVLLAAPYLLPSRPQARVTRNFADLIAHITFFDDAVLRAHADAWRGLMELVRPDVIVFDHSPTALLAARGAAPAAKRVIVGNGFLIPPDVAPFPVLRTWMKMSEQDVEEMGRDEEAVLERANRLLTGWNAPESAKLGRLGQLFGDVDLTLMMTMRELDPYAAHRPQGTAYLGAVNASGGAEPEWPDGRDGAPKVYAYLKPVAAMADVMKYLGERRVPSIVFAPQLTDAGRKRFEGYKSLRFETGRLDLARAAGECDVAILNGNLGTSSAMLLAGKPALHLPEHLEHALNARAVARLGAGLVAPEKDSGVASGKLAALLGCEDHHAAAARKVAARYADFSAARQAERMVEALAALVDR